MPLYVDGDTGKTIVTHSMLKSMRTCPKQTQFKYGDRLKPKLLSTPLRRGTWMHTLLEIHHMGGDWRAEHKKLSMKFDELMDEEKDYYGDLPNECLAIMEAYIWHYKEDPWKVLEVEFTLETEMPDGTVYRGKVDALIENQFGLWLVDHKTHKRFPNFSFRLLDTQSALYLWAAKRNNLPVKGFIWNYVKTLAPSKPTLIKDGSRLSKKLGETDYVTFVKELRRLKNEHGFTITREHLDFAETLKSHRYVPDGPQKSPFFRRAVLEKDDRLLHRVAQENFHTAQRMNDYPWEDREMVERNVDMFRCETFCSYTDICTIELLGANTKPLMKQKYTVGDPQDYYQDRGGESKKGA